MYVTMFKNHKGTSRSLEDRITHDDDVTTEFDGGEVAEVYFDGEGDTLLVMMRDTAGTEVCITFDELAKVNGATRKYMNRRELERSTG